MTDRFFTTDNAGDRVERPVLAQRGPLAIVQCYDFGKMQVVQGLFLIYVRKGEEGWRVGPFYAKLGLAHRDMMKLHAQFPETLWAQPLGWLSRQKSLKVWIDKNLGASGELVGAEWAKP